MEEEQPLKDTDEQQIQSEAIKPEVSDADLKHVRGLMYALITICVFCASILLGPDEQILPADGDLKIPIVNLTIKQDSFLYFGPIIIICVSLYSYLFLLRIMAQVRAGRKSPNQYIFAMRHPAAQIATYGIFFWLPTFVLFAFAYKGFPRPESANLLGVALIFLIFIVTVQVLLRRYQFEYLDIIAVSIISVTLVLFGFLGEKGYLEKFHGNLRMLRPMILDRVDLEKRDLREVEISFTQAESLTLRGAFLKEAVIRHSTLNGANLEGADLNNATIECTYFQQANFDLSNLKAMEVNNSDFKKAKFRGADLSKARFYSVATPDSSNRDCPEETDLYGANLEKANLFKASFIKVFLNEAKFNGAKLIKTKILGSSVQASNFGKKFLRETDLTRADLRCSSFTGSEMEGAILIKVQLGGTNLSLANLTNADLSGANFYKLSCGDMCIDRYSKDKKNNDYIESRTCSGADPREAKLYKTNLAFANLQRSELSEVDLEEADLRGADLQGATLSQVTLDKTNLLLTNLSMVTGLKCPELVKAKFWQASIRDKALECGQTVLDFTDFHDIGDDDKESLENFKTTLERFVGLYSQHPRKKIGKEEENKEVFKLTEKAVMKGISIARFKLDDIWLVNADLERTILTAASLNRANFKGAKLMGANMQNASLNGANLIGANMQVSSMPGESPPEKPTSLRHAKLIGAKLIGADLTGANLIGANLIDTKFGKANLSRSDLLRANLTGANLIEADLTDASLIAAKLDGADLDRAILTGVKGLSCIQLEAALNWEKSYRSKEFGCGQPIPERQKAVQ